MPPAVAANATLYEHLNFDFIRDAAPVAGATDQSRQLATQPLPAGAIHIWTLPSAGFRLVGIGGLWENWKEPTSGEWIRTFVVITTDAYELVAQIHNRMPLILAPSDYARWLSNEPDPRDLLRPFPAGPMRMWPISTRVNKPENDDPSILEPVGLSPTVRALSIIHANPAVLNGAPRSEVEMKGDLGSCSRCSRRRARSSSPTIGWVRALGG